MKKQSDIDNRANQLNHEHDAYWKSRGLSPDDDGEDLFEDYEEGYNDYYDPRVGMRIRFDSPEFTAVTRLFGLTRR